MTAIGRAWRGLSRMPWQSAALVATVALGVALSLTGLSVGATAREGLLTVRSTLGSTVVLSPVSPPRDGDQTDPRRSDRTPSDRAPTLTQTLAASLAASPYVGAVDLSFRARATSSVIRAVDPTGVQYAQGDAGLGVERPPGFWLAGNSAADETVGIPVRGDDLKAGRLYTRAEVDARAPVALVSEQLAGLNGLAVDMVIELTNPVTGTSSALTIIGVFASSTGGLVRERIVAGQGSLLFGDANTIYAPYTSVQDFADKAGQLSSAIYYLNRPQDVDAFRRDAAAAGLSSAEYRLWSYDAEYAALGSPLTKLGGLGAGAVVGAVLAGLIAVAAVATIAIRSRMDEFAILLAMGARRSDVLKQAMAESGLAGLIGTGIGLLVGRPIAASAARSLLIHELAAGIADRAIGRGIVAGDGGGLFQWASEALQTIPTQLTSGRIGAPEIALAGLVGIGLTLIAALVSMRATRQAKPGDALVMVE